MMQEQANNNIKAENTNNENTSNEANIKLDNIEKQLKSINKNLLNVFWIVGFFAFLYFGLMIYLLFLR